MKLLRKHLLRDKAGGGNFEYVLHGVALVEGDLGLRSSRPQPPTSSGAMSFTNEASSSWGYQQNGE